MKPTLEHQFLPAALEIQETPPSPLGRAIVWLIVAFFLAALVWSAVGSVDIVAVAPGKIIPDGHVKVIQPLEIGTVTAIHVKEGQAVRQGDPLIDLDPSAVDAEIAQLSAENILLQQQRKRLAWLIDHTHERQDDQPDWNDPVLSGQWLEFRDRIATLQSEKRQRQAERTSAEQQVKKLTAILPIIEQRSTNEQTLVDKQLFPVQQHLETEQQRLTTLYDLRTQQGRVDELQQTLAAIDDQIRHTRSEFAKTNLEQAEETESRLNNIAQELVKARARQKTLHLTAPIDGIVQQLAVHTIGGIVTPAQELMVVVPQGSQLEIEAYVENKDIGFVREGQPAAIKLDAFPFTKYGTLDGDIVDLSDDAVSDEDKGLIYKARVGMKQNSIDVDGKPMRLGPGMAVSVEIKTGQRRLIEFFLAPLLRYKDESVRER